MSKSKRFKTPYKNEKQSNFSFVSLLSYCSQEQQDKFVLGLKEKPVSSLLFNRSLVDSSTLLSYFPDLKKDEQDDLLYRFDKSEDQLGKTLFHFGGAFYILDPSSAAISYHLQNLLPQNFVAIDLCAAPGGKTIALDLRRRDGLFLANDISYERAIEINKNCQRLALSNVISCSMDPVHIPLSSCFDLTILDAPCSGSGMIRKEPKMKNDFSLEKVNRLLPIQEALLEKAYHLTKKGGIIAYSTCSLSMEEDENQVQLFLHNHPDMEVIPIEEKKHYVSTGLGYHMIPGIYDGEGIYFILLRKTSGETIPFSPVKELKPSSIPSLNIFNYKNNSYLVSNMMQEFLALPLLSPGLKIYDRSEHPKCEFDHSYSKVSNSLPLYELTKEEAQNYVQGNEIKTQNPDGLVILTYLHMRLGLGKVVQGKIKNYLPKGLRGYLN